MWWWWITVDKKITFISGPREEIEIALSVLIRISVCMHTFAKVASCFHVMKGNWNDVQCGERRGYGKKSERDIGRVKERWGNKRTEETQDSELEMERWNGGQEWLHIAFNDIIVARGVYNLVRWRNGRYCTEREWLTCSFHTHISLCDNSVWDACAFTGKPYTDLILIAFWRATPHLPCV